jgi:nitrilase
MPTYEERLVWPGNRRNTEDITRFIARESRSFVVSVSGLMRRSDIDASLPHADVLIETTTAEFDD